MSTTDDMLQKLEKKIAAQYQKAAKEAHKKLKAKLKEYNKRLKINEKALKKGKITKEQFDSWKKAQAYQNKNMKDLADVLAKDASNSSKIATALINDTTPDVYAINANEAMYQIDQNVKIGTSFSLYDHRTVENLIAKNPDIYPITAKVKEGKVKRWNKRKMNEAITQGILQGESIPNISKRVGKVFNMDKNASTRTARTMVTCAQSLGRIDSYKRATEMGIPLVQKWVATLDGRTRHSHIYLDGQTREIGESFESLYGSIDYPADPSADPRDIYNCFVGETNIATDSEVIRSYKHNYSGRFVTVKTAGGVNFTCTPNHPILTIGGWVPAESLQKGNDILVAFRRNDVFGRINPNINHVFPRIDAIHKLFNMLGGDRTVSMSVNFHGDISTSDVEIITKKRLLREGRDSGAFNSINKFLLKHSDKSFLRLRSFSKHFGRIWSSALGFVGGVSKSLPFFFTGLRHPEIHRLRPIALLYSGRVKPLDNDVARNAELISECLDGFSGFVFADNIVSVDFSSGCSHVYNLQTENGYYFVNSSIAQSKRKSNGIFAIAHNCRCSLIAQVKGFEYDIETTANRANKLGGESYEQWKSRVKKKKE